jgi:ATP-dependent protease ClpP protease subunit
MKTAHISTFLSPIRLGWLLALCVLPLGCQRAAPALAGRAEVVTMGNRSDAHVARDSTPRPAPPPADYLAGTQWPSAQLRDGEAWISCDEHLADGDGAQVQSLDFLALVDALTPCRGADPIHAGVVRLRYHGTIDAGFTSLVERVGAIAKRMNISERILDIDSTGGQVEEAIRAGDAIAGTQWAIWVRDGSICHSACVLVLAAGDTRSIASTGKVGIHRLMRDRSIATTRRELSEELADITAQVRDYLARNGVATALADQMMTIPNRDLRILTTNELARYGLSGTNAVQDDLDRIVLMRQCGDDFVHRRDGFMRAFDASCMKPGRTADAVLECGHALQPGFGFPDDKCADLSPMAYYAQRAGEALPETPRSHRGRGMQAE